jgi:hypothetical protein
MIGIRRRNKTIRDNPNPTSLAKLSLAGTPKFALDHG